MIVEDAGEQIVAMPTRHYEALVKRLDDIEQRLAGMQEVAS